MKLKLRTLSENENTTELVDCHQEIHSGGLEKESGQGKKSKNVQRDILLRGNCNTVLQEVEG